METARAIGLLLFSIVTGLNAFGLGLDYVLTQAKLPTVSEWARANQWIAAIIMILQCVAVFGLAVHLTNWPEQGGSNSSLPGPQ
jgi:hypothetical protein